MEPEFFDYGLWWLVAINSLIFIVFAFSFFRPKSARDWRSFGAFSAFLVALFTEMYGFPLTIYLLSGWLASRFPGVDWYAHDSGHLLEMTFGWGGNPHVGPFHTLSSIFVFGGFLLLAAAWRVLYRAQRAQTAAMTGPYALVRHPQYAAFISIMFGFLLQWPTLPTLVMFPILVFMYARLARREEMESLAGLGEEYRGYVNRVPAFFPHFHNALRLAAIIVLIFSLPSLIASLAGPQPGEAAHQRSSGAGTSRADPAVRQDLILAHFDALRGIGESTHEINLKMFEDADYGRVASDPGLKRRLPRDADAPR